MPPLFTELRRRNVFKVGWACTKMEQFRLTLTVNQCPLLAESRHWGAVSLERWRGWHDSKLRERMAAIGSVLSLGYVSRAQPMKAIRLGISLFLLTCALTSPVVVALTIEFETTEVTGADVALSPDGESLMFTILGHLFRLPVEGGTAEQLTFGPYYDSNPVFSPDGNRVAFVSNRDGNEGNVFVLELATGRITQVTHEPWAGRPTWTPDGQAIVYLSFTGTTLNFFYLVPALVRRVSLDGGEPETLSAPPRLFRSVFYLPDGRLAWTVVEREGPNPIPTTQIEVMSPLGVVSTVRTLDGEGDRTVPSPAGDGLYWRRRSSDALNAASPKALSFVPMPDGAERELSSVPGRLYWDPQFAVAADNKSLYLGQDGRLWRIALPSRARRLIAFRARVSLEIQDITPPPKWTRAPVGGYASLRSVRWPRLSPDGRSLVFGAAGYLWQQALDGGEAGRGVNRRILTGTSIARCDRGFVRSE